MLLANGGVHSVTSTGTLSISHSVRQCADYNVRSGFYQYIINTSLELKLVYTINMTGADDLQGLLRFLTKDAKLPLAVAMSKVKDLKEMDLAR